MLLPMGDFSALTELPKTYQHCKTTEDPDMDIADFVFGHLLNLDENFEEQNDSDEQELPHNPQPFHITNAGVYYQVNRTESIVVCFKTNPPIVQPPFKSPYFSRLNTNRIFQPPRV